MFLNPFYGASPTENFHRATRSPSSPIPFLSLSLSPLFLYLVLSLRIFFTLSELLILPCSRSTNGGCVTMTTYELSVTCRPFPSLSHVPCTMHVPIRRVAGMVLVEDRDMLYNFDNASANISPQMSEGHNETWRNFDNASANTSKGQREYNGSDRS